MNLVKNKVENMSKKIIQIITEELKENFIYNGINSNIYKFSNLFSDENSYDESFIKNTRLKIYTIRVAKAEQDNKSTISLFKGFGKYHYFDEHAEINPPGSIILSDLSAQARIIIDNGFIDIFNNLIPFDYSLYLTVNHDSLKDKIFNEYLYPKDIHFVEISDKDTVFECVQEDFKKIYNNYFKKNEQGKGFILRKTSFYYLKTYYEDNKDAESIRDLLNNSFLIFELLPYNEGVLILSNRNNNLELFTEKLELKKINRELAKIEL